MGTWVAAIVAVLTVTGCKYGADSFACTDNASCGGVGMCQPNNLCSFPDATCPSGQRYGDIAGTASGECVGETQMPPDAMPDAPPDARACFGSGLVTVCLTAAPSMPLTIGAAGKTIDTSDNTMCTPTVSGADNYCVVAATTITVDGTLHAKGAKPLVLLASDTITVTQLIDVGSHRSSDPEFIGAGADPAAPLCMPGTTVGNRAGGAGGTFTGVGGKGGDAAGGGGGNGGNAGTATTANALRGGCPGENGDGGGGGVGGHGGGAVYLIAGNKIDVTGPGINAGGEGGGNGSPAAGNSSGAGGGGSGGMIGLDATMITCTSPLIANGGAGGEGSGTASIGAPGGDGGLNGGMNGTSAAQGGINGSGIGGDGGNGSAGAAAGAGANGKNGSSQGGSDGGGGGGGGGAGIIKATTGAALGNMVSPAATP